MVGYATAEVTSTLYSYTYGYVGIPIAEYSLYICPVLRPRVIDVAGQGPSSRSLTVTADDLNDVGFGCSTCSGKCSSRLLRLGFGWGSYPGGTMTDKLIYVVFRKSDGFNLVAFESLRHATDFRRRFENPLDYGVATLPLY